MLPALVNGEGSALTRWTVTSQIFSSCLQLGECFYYYFCQSKLFLVAGATHRLIVRLIGTDAGRGSPRTPRITIKSSRAVFFSLGDNASSTVKTNIRKKQERIFMIPACRWHSLRTAIKKEKEKKIEAQTLKKEPEQRNSNVLYGGQILARFPRIDRGFSFASWTMPNFTRRNANTPPLEFRLKFCAWFSYELTYKYGSL